jgi:hypothetical protein
MSAKGLPWFTGKLVVGVAFALFGAAVLLDNLELADARQFLRFFWPGLWIALGAALIANRWGERGAFWGVASIAAGLWLLADQLDLIRFGFFQVAVPAVLLMVGGTLIFRALAGPPVAAETFGAGGGVGGGEGVELDDVVNAFALMSGNERKSNARSFRGGDLTAVMGGVELDLRGARPAPGGATLDVFAFWGGVGVKVPEGWQVTSRVVPLLGGFEDKTRPVVGDAKGQLLVRGFAIMGGVEVSN